jgi:hypothetical protein
MGKGTTEIYESSERFGDVVGEWGFIILKAPLPDPLLKGEGKSIIDLI